METAYDVIVVGSGFGGSVSALRLTEKGYRVLVLEKGRRYRPEDFPRTNWNLRKSVWLPHLGLHGIWGLTLLRHVFVLHGVGVGGGSLNYCNNLLVPPNAVLNRPGWGPGRWKERLAAHYTTARRMLGANPSPTVGRADRMLQEIGKEIRGEDTFHVNDVGVFFGEPGKRVPDPYFGGRGPERTGCTFCGACMTGCREGGKNTLDKNYLFLAEALGVTVIPETEVTGVRPTAGGYEVATRRTTGLRREARSFRATRVVLSGGVMGTVKLLLRCRRSGLLPRLSDRLGDFVRTNSEALVGAVARDRNADFSDHLSINSGIYPDDATHVEVVRFAKGSDLMGLITTLLTDGGGRVPRPVRFLGTVARQPLDFLRDLNPMGWGARTPILLVMQTTDSHMQLDYRPRWYRLGGCSMNSRLAPGAAPIPSYIPVANEIARRLAERIHGRPVSSWPEVLLDVPTTAHILGGAVMGETPEQGVVGFDGQVHGYPGLYVVDGSNVPVNLGVNPSLTITAMAETVMEQVPKKSS
jgi:cholesterol oxidase